MTANKLILWSRTHGFWLGLAVCILFGCAQAATRFHFSLYIDEPWAANLVHVPLVDMWKIFQNDGAQQPLYFLLLKPVVILFGESEIPLRCPSLVFYSIMMIVTGLAARALGGEIAGLIAAFLVSISGNLGHFYAATARQYALLGLAAALAYYCTLSFVQISECQGSNQWSLNRKEMALTGLFLITALAGLLTHIIFLFCILACAGSLLFFSKKAFIFIASSGLISIAVFLLLWGNIAIIGFHNTAISWIPKPGPREFLKGLTNLWGGQAGILILIFLTLIAWHERVTLFSYFKGNRGRILLTLTLAITLSPIIVSQFKPLYFSSRTPILYLPLISILAAVLISNYRHRWITLGVIVILAVSSLYSSIYNLKLTMPTHTSLEYVLDHASCGDRLVSVGLSYSEVEYYLRHLEAPKCILHIVFPADIENHPGWFDNSSLGWNYNNYVADADQIARTAFLNPNSRVWLFNHSSSRLSTIMKSELDHHASLVIIFRSGGTFFDEIICYQPTK